MKVKTNLRAGSGSVNSGGVNSGGTTTGGSVNSGGVNGGHSSSIDNTVVSYVPPVTTARCVGI